MPIPSIVSVPQSATETRASHLAQYFTFLGLEDNPAVFIPARLGHDTSPFLDLGADALIHLLHSPKTQQGVVLPSRLAARDYTRALTLFRAWFSSGEASVDGCLSAICLLGLFGVLVRDRHRATVECFTHWRGASAVIVQDALASSANSYAWATVGPTAGGCLTFIIPCFQGRDSPFDGAPGWSQMPVMSSLDSPEGARLNQVSYHLFVRLPRLMRLVREWKTGGAQQCSEEVTRLAKELVGCEEPDAERWLLARTKACPTQHPITARVIPDSFRMASTRDAATALCYWQTRIMALKLLDTVEACSPPHRETEEDRMAMNILKACEYTESCGYCATAPVPIALVTVWLVFRLRWKDQEAYLDDLAVSILETQRRSWSGTSCGGTRESLDKVASALVGGKLKGYLCEVVLK